MKRVYDVHKQLITIMDQYKLNIPNIKLNYKDIYQAIIVTCFTNAIKIDLQKGYHTIIDQNPIYIGKYDLSKIGLDNKGVYACFNGD